MTVGSANLLRFGHADPVLDPPSTAQEPDGPSIGPSGPLRCGAWPTSCSAMRGWWSWGRGLGGPARWTSWWSEASCRRWGTQLDRPLGIEEYDAEGRWLIPGLWDHHVHLAQWTARDAAARPVRIRVARARSSRAYAPTWPTTPGRWSASATASAPGGPSPTVAALDAVAPEIPVVLIAGDAHHGWLNSRALERLGLPPREGVVAENEWYDAYTRIDAVAAPDLSPAAYRRTLDSAAALGITGIVDLERGQTPADWEERDPPVRLRVATYADGLDATIAAGLRTGDRLPGSSELVTMGPLKIIGDGSLNTRTAWCCEEYADGSGAGAPNQTSAELAGPPRARPRPRPRGRDPRDRRPGPARGPGGVRRDRCGRLDRARPAGDAARPSPRWPGSACERACSRLTCSTTATSPS